MWKFGWNFLLKFIGKVGGYFLLKFIGKFGWEFFLLKFVDRRN